MTFFSTVTYTVRTSHFHLIMRIHQSISYQKMFIPMYMSLLFRWLYYILLNISLIWANDITYRTTSKISLAHFFLHLEVVCSTRKKTEPGKPHNIIVKHLGVAWRSLRPCTSNWRHCFPQEEWSGEQKGRLLTISLDISVSLGLNYLCN